MTQPNNTNDIVFDLNGSISVIMSVIKKRWKLFLLFYCILLSITIIYNLNKKNIYQTSFTMSNSEISSVELKTIIESYNDFKKNNLPSLSGLNLKQIEVQYLDDNTFEGHTLKIKMTIYDTSFIKRNLEDLMSYCNNAYLVKKVNTKNENLFRIIENYKKQLAELILYKQKTEQEKINSGYIAYYNVFRDIAVLQETISRLEYELSQFKGVEVSILPVAPFKVQGLSFIKSVILAAILGIVFCPFLVFFFDKILANPKKE